MRLYLLFLFSFFLSTFACPTHSVPSPPASSTDSARQSDESLPDIPECPICLEKTFPHQTPKEWPFDCPHAPQFHEECILAHIAARGDAKCPLCRKGLLGASSPPELKSTDEEYKKIVWTIRYRSYQQVRDYLNTVRNRLTPTTMLDFMTVAQESHHLCATLILLVKFSRSARHLNIPREELKGIYESILKCALSDRWSQADMFLFRELFVLGGVPVEMLRRLLHEKWSHLPLEAKQILLDYIKKNPSIGIFHSDSEAENFLKETMHDNLLQRVASCSQMPSGYLVSIYKRDLKDANDKYDYCNRRRAYSSYDLNYYASRFVKECFTAYDRMIALQRGLDARQNRDFVAKFDENLLSEVLRVAIRAPSSIMKQLLGFSLFKTPAMIQRAYDWYLKIRDDEKEREKKLHFLKDFAGKVGFKLKLKKIKEFFLSRPY